MLVSSLCLPLVAGLSLSETRPKFGEVRVAAQSSSTPSVSSEWKDAIDPTTGRMYYWNRKTRESRWDRPEDENVPEADGDDASATEAAVEETPTVATPLLSRVSDFASRSATSMSALRKKLFETDDGTTGRGSVVGKTIYIGGVFIAAAAIL